MAKGKASAVAECAASRAPSQVDPFARNNLPPREQWPDLLLERPEFRYSARLNCVAELLDHWVANGRGDESCLASAEGTLTYCQLAEKVNRIANVLVSRCGLKTGNRVLLRSGNTLQMAACYLAVIKAGAIVVATMPLLRAAEIAYPLNKAEVSIALCDAKLREDMERAQAMAPDLHHVLYWGTDEPGSLDRLVEDASPVFEVAPTASDDVCLIAFTSGTTGQPKGTMHFHRDMLAICDGYARHVARATRDDTVIATAPLAFTFGLAALLFPMRVGATGVLLERASPAELAAAIEAFRPTICFTAPTAYRQLLTTNADLSSLRRCISAGEALTRATFDAWKAATGLPLIDGIGGTEMLHIYLSATEDDLRPGATGRPVPGFEARIVDDTGREVPRNIVGRLAVRGPIGCRYLADSRQTEYVRDGWNYPGDSFLQDDDGYFWYQARNDSMIVSSGYNIAAPEVEAALARHPAVIECAVIGVPNEARGSIVKAFVVATETGLDEAALASQLQDFVKREIAPYKYPREITFVASLPKTASGKVRHVALRTMSEGQPSSA